MRKTLIFLAAMVLGVGFLPAARASVNDPLAPQQYGYTQIQAPSAWTKATGRGIIIAVVDSGTDVNHEDLHPQLVANCPGTGCHDYGDNDDNPQDDSLLKDGNGHVVKGHGTHVSGLAAAAANNGKGGVGIAPDAKILPLKIFSSNANSSGGLAGGITNVPQAVNFAVQHGAKVINLSLGDFNVGVVGPIQTACNTAASQGSLCVVAAGNSGQDKPSGYQHNFQALVVTANDKDGNHTSFGQWADTQWGVSAPGLFNWSTWPTDDGQYKSISGTSMASPQAAGVAALVFSQHPTWTPAQVAEQVVSTADPMGNPTVNGAGRVNAARAVGAPVTAPSDPGTKSHASGNNYPTSPTASGGSTGGSSKAPAGASGPTKATLPPAGGTDDADLANIGNGTQAIGTQNTKSGSGSGSKVTGQQILELTATLLLIMAAVSTLSASRRLRPRH